MAEAGLELGDLLGNGCAATHQLGEALLNERFEFSRLDLVVKGLAEWLGLSPLYKQLAIKGVTRLKGARLSA